MQHRISQLIGSRAIRRGLTAGLLLLGLPRTSARADIELNVAHAGFPAISPAGDVFRYGTWVPIIVDIALVNESSFDGFVRTAQTDSDGDRCYDSVEVHLRAESGGTQRVFLYALASPNDRDKGFDVELRDVEGDLVSVISEGRPTFRAEPVGDTVAIAHDDLLVLSVSTGAAGRVADLADRTVEYTRVVHVAHISPTDLPELHIGLDMVDCIVWDDSRPEQLTQKQLSAMIDWVKHGGTLLMAASTSSGSIRLSEELKRILPVELGELVTVDNLPSVREKLLAAPKQEGEAAPVMSDWYHVPFPAPAPLVRCKLVPGAHVVEAEESVPVVTRRMVQRGNVIFSAITLRDLFSAPCTVEPFFQRLFYLLKHSPDQGDRAVPESIYDHVVSAVGFSASGTFYLLLAALFSIGYVAAATFGLWRYLGAKGWQKHSWTAFAAAGGVASVLSVMAVGAVRGIGDRLHQVTVIDLHAGEREAFGTGYFGLKTGIDKQVDVWLPDDWVAAREEPAAGLSSLRPLPVNSESSELRTSFADPAEYRVAPSMAAVQDVRIRATLKRFEGRWTGPLKGSVHGRIRMAGSRILEGSFLANELGVPLKNCELLIPINDPDEVGTVRSGTTTALSVGELPSDGLKTALDELQALRESESRLPKLGVLQTDWSRPFLQTLGFGGDSRTNLGQERNALLLSSTVGDFDPPTQGQFQGMFGRRTISRERLRQFDLRSHLLGGAAPDEEEKIAGNAGSAVLIGFADDPGPMRLFSRSGDRDFRMIEPEAANSWSMYRVRIPIERVDVGLAAEETGK